MNVRREAMNRLEDKVAIVTGASRGIGKAVALEFARQGAHLVVVAVTDVAATQEVTDGIKALGREAISAMADVSQRVEVDAFVQAALDRYGKVDILVNNAGIISPSLPLQLTESQWDRTMVKGTFKCTQAVAPHMKERGGGKIINVTAPSVLRASTLGEANYAAAKGGISLYQDRG